MGSRSLLSSFLWLLSLLLVCCAVAGCLASAALASGVVGVYADRPLANAYSSLWPCLALLYFGYLAALEQTPDALQESATFVLTQTPARSRHLRRLMLVLLALSIPVCILLLALGLCSDWASITFGLVFPCLLLGFFAWHVSAYTSEYQSSQGPSKLALAWHNLMYLLLSVMFGFHAAGWAIYGRYDLLVWDALAIIACLVNIYLIDARSYKIRIRNKKGKLYREVELTNPLEPRVVVEQEYKKTLTGATKVALYMNLFLKCMFVLLTVLLVNGSLYHGSGMQLFYGFGLARGTRFVTIESEEGGGAGGWNQKIHYKCQGEDYSDMPTLILEAGPSRDLTDLSGLFSAFSKSSRVKICAFDKPGLGRSSLLKLGQFLHHGGHFQYYTQILEAISEKEGDAYGPPYALVGLGESGSRLVYEYASTSHFPSSSFIHSLSLFHPFPFPTKYQHEQLRRNISEGDFLAEELKRTLVYNSLVVPFGLGPYFMGAEEDKEIPSDWRNGYSYDYYMPHDFGPYWKLWDVQEKMWEDKSEKHWNSKYWEIRRRMLDLHFIGGSADVYDLQLPGELSVNVVSTPMSSETAGDLCYELDFSYDDCDSLWELSEASQDRSKTLAVGGNWLQMGEERGCASEAEMLFTQPNVVADTLIYDIYGGGK